MELIEAIKKAGVVGAGGAGFPTHVKLNAKAEYLIINAAECEPLIETDKFLCREFADRIIDTILLMGHHLEAQHIVIGLKAKYKAEIAALEKAIREKHAAVEIFPMRTFYPAAGAGSAGDRAKRSGKRTSIKCGSSCRECWNRSFHCRCVGRQTCDGEVFICYRCSERTCDV